MRRSTAYLVALASGSCILLTTHHLTRRQDKVTRQAYTWFESFANSYTFSLSRTSSCDPNILVGPPKTTKAKAACDDDPYAMPGHLHVATETKSLSENRWLPLVDGCETPRLLDSFVAAMDKESSDEKTDEMGKREWKRKREDVEWARNRTVVLFGDSVLRENIAYFCEMVGAELHRVTWSHAFAPRPRPEQHAPPLHPAFTSSSSIYTTFPPPADPDADPDLATAWTPEADLGEGDQSHLAHYCYVQEMGFLLVQQFQYGMDQEDYWAFKPGYIPPGTFEDRLYTLLLPIVDKAIVSHHPDLAVTGAVSNTMKGKKAPALIMLNSAFWDTARWVREDMRFGRDTDGALSSERLRWYKTRVRQAVLSVAEVYPDSAISWMTHHYPTGSGPSDWFTSGIEVASQQHSNDAARNGKARATRPGNTVLRLTELDSVVRAALQYPDDDRHDPTCNARSETGKQQDDDDMNDGWTTHNCASSGLNDDQRQTLQHVRINEWGKIMLGQEKHMKDALHQALVPGGRLWADMMLFGLRRAVRMGGER